jgi:hypothetical protein
MVAAVFELSRKRDRELICPDEFAVNGKASAIPTLLVSTKLWICVDPKTTFWLCPKAATEKTSTVTM